jgi:hypothetical protein
MPRTKLRVTLPSAIAAPSPDPCTEEKKRSGLGEEHDKGAHRAIRRDTKLRTSGAETMRTKMRKRGEEE